MPRKKIKGQRKINGASSAKGRDKMHEEKIKNLNGEMDYWGK